MKATAKPTGWTSAYVPRNHTTWAKANVQPAKTAMSGTTSKSSASAAIDAAPAATAIAESAFKRAATVATGTRCVQSQPSRT